MSTALDSIAQPQRPSLLGLPPELREEIYHMAYDQWQLDQGAIVRFDRTAIAIKAARRRGQQVSLHRVCSQLRRECLSFFYHLAIFCFNVNHRNARLFKWAQAAGDADLLSVVTRLVLVVGTAHPQLGPRVVWAYMRERPVGHRWTTAGLEDKSLDPRVSDCRSYDAHHRSGDYQHFIRRVQALATVIDEMNLIHRVEKRALTVMDLRKIAILRTLEVPLSRNEQYAKIESIGRSLFGGYISVAALVAVLGTFYTFGWLR